MKKKIALVVALVILLLSSAFVLYISLGQETVIPENNTVLNTQGDGEETIPGNSDNLDQADDVIDEDNSDIILGITVDQVEIIADENALFVSGIANTYEATVNFKLYGDDGILVVEDFTTANMPDMGIAGPFEKVIAFAMPNPNVVTGYLEVFEYSARDGSQVNMVTVPVSFPYNDFMTLNVFFSHSAPAGIPGECLYVQSVERILPASLAVAKHTIWAMLQGPKAAETAEGFFTGIPSGTTLNSIYIEDRIAYVDFSIELNSTAGSCGIAGVTSMIRENLLQFSTIDDVVISVEGQTEDILQP